MTMIAQPYNFGKRLREIDMFFQGTDKVHQTMYRVTETLERAGIPYAIVGGMAVNAHRYERTTGDVDILMTLKGFEEFRRHFVPANYEPQPKRPRRFVDLANGVTLDILVTGRFPGSGKPGPVAYPDPSEVSETIHNIRVIDLKTLIQLKLAARRHKDFGDVVSLIRVHGLDESFLPGLHPSLHRDFLECLEEKRREDEYEAREDEQVEELLEKDIYEADNP
jgi:hypothetical protein